MLGRSICRCASYLQRPKPGTGCSAPGLAGGCEMPSIGARN